MSSYKKIILIPIYDGTITKNLLRTDFLSHLIAGGNVKVVIIPPSGKIEIYKDEFAIPDTVIIETTPVWRHDRLEFIFSSIFKHSIPTTFMKIRQVDWYWNKGRYFSYFFTSFLRFMGRFRWWRKMLLVLNNIEPIPNEIQEIYDRWKPDLVFAPTMIPRGEVALMRLARKNGKKVVGMVKSFDNLTSKSYLRVHPDLLIVPNLTTVNEAVTLYDYPKSKIIPTGICQYDIYCNSADLMQDREEFYGVLDLDPKKKTILYAPAGDWMNPTDHETLGIILDWIDQGELPGVQVLLRLHPAYESQTEKLQGHPALVVERPGTHFGNLTSYEFDEADVKHLANSLKYSDIIINTGATFMIEGAIFDTPIIALGFDGHNKEPYWRSIIRYYDREHLVPIVKTGGLILVRSKEELLESIKAYLNKPEMHQLERKLAVEMVCFKMDGKACERTANVLLETLA